MRGVTSAQLSPGARTCIVVGALDDVGELDLRPYRFVLWFAPRAARMPARFGVDPAAVTTEPVERFDRTRGGVLLDQFIGRDALRLPALFLTDGVKGPAAASFLPVVEEIHVQFESNQRARVTRQADGFQWQAHLLANLPAYVRQRMPASWAGALAGVPAFVCGAGPSLDASAPKLAAVAASGVVLAADSALRALAKHGIGVDFAVSIDARKTPEKCLAENAPAPGRVVLAGISPPSWLATVPAERIAFLSGRQVTEDWLAGLGAGKTAVSAVENCGITALELAVYLGCGPIYLFGMDHAVDSQDSNRWHQREGAADLHAHLGFAADRNYPKVPGNYQPEIATPLFREWRMLDARCAALPPGLVSNVIDRGAKLRNTTVVHPNEFSPPATPTDRTGALARLAPTPAANPAGREALLARVHAVAFGMAPVVEEAREAVAAGAPRKAIELLTGLLRDERCRMLLGNYCLKIVPHLLQPDENDAPQWETLVRECQELVRVALMLR